MLSGCSFFLVTTDSVCRSIGTGVDQVRVFRCRVTCPLPLMSRLWVWRLPFRQPSPYCMVTRETLNQQRPKPLLFERVRNFQHLRQMLATKNPPSRIPSSPMPSHSSSRHRHFLGRPSVSVAQFGMPLDSVPLGRPKRQCIICSKQYFLPFGFKRNTTGVWLWSQTAFSNGSEQTHWHTPALALPHPAYFSPHEMERTIDTVFNRGLRASIWALACWAMSGCLLAMAYHTKAWP